MVQHAFFQPRLFPLLVLSENATASAVHGDDGEKTVAATYYGVENLALGDSKAVSH